ILRIRRELGDDAKEQRLLRTIPRFGYRWVAALDSEEYTAPAASPPAARAATLAAAPPVAESESTTGQPESLPVDHAPATSDMAAPAAATKPARQSAARLAALVIVVALVLGGAVWALRFNQKSPLRAPGLHGDALVSAVLPAVVEPGDESAWMHLG